MNNLNILFQSLKHKHWYVHFQKVGSFKITRCYNIVIYSYYKKKDKYNLHINICMYFSKNGTSGNSLKVHYQSIIVVSI